MARKETVVNRITSFDESWDNNHTGQEVEDFVTTKLIEADGEKITNMSYVDQQLILHKANGNTIKTEVSVITPKYYYGIKLYGIRIDSDNDKIYTAANTEVTIQYTPERKIEAGVILYAISQTSNINDQIGPFDVKFQLGTQRGVFKVNNIPYKDCITDNNNAITGVVYPDPVANIAWIDITSLFTVTQTNANLSATVVKSDTIVTDTLSLRITNQKIDLVYDTDSALVNISAAQFTLKGGSVGDYHLEGFNNGVSIGKTTNGSVTVTGLIPGLNQLVIRAVHNQFSDIYTDWVYVDLIYTEELDDTTVAINKVSRTIPNNGVATLYELTIYSPNQDTATLTTYLEETEPDGNNPTNTVKYEVISAASYDKDNIYTTSYKKYMEINGTSNERYLMVKTGNTFYRFYEAFTNRVTGEISAPYYEYKSMVIEAIDDSLTYFQDVTPSLNYDQSTGRSNNVFVTQEYSGGGTPANINPNLEISDGWKEEGDRTIFRVSAQNNPILTSPLNLNLGTQFTIELGFKTYNVSDRDKPILTIGTFQLRPAQFCFDTQDNTLFNARNAQFQVGKETHIVMTVEGGHSISKSQTYYPNYLGDFQQKFDNAVATVNFNLVRIYVNGTIDREIIINASELAALRQATLQIAPTTSDIDLYLFRVYNTRALTMDEVLKNYISFLSKKEDKLAFKEANDLLNANGEISFDKAFEKYNTIVYVLPKGCRFPNRGWGKEDGKAKKDMAEFPVTIFVNYIDPEVNKQYGGKMVDQTLTAQGSSAMRYLIWNCQNAFGKFKDKRVNENGEYLDKKGNVVTKEDEAQDLKRKSAFISYSDANFDTETYTFKPEATTTYNNYYIMPPYAGAVSDDKSKIKKAVGKVNFASSQQSHKIGCMKLYDDAYKNINGALLTGGRKGSREEPFLYFYWESEKLPNKAGTLTKEQNSNPDLWKTWSEDSVQKAELAELFNNPDVHFMGFQTWGSAKADDATYGYDENITPEYLLVEGGENTDPAVNFRIPWHALQRGTGVGAAKSLAAIPQISYTKSLEEPWSNLLIADESIVYDIRGALDIDYGVEELKDSSKQKYYEIAKEAHNTIKFYREFHDFVYSHDYTFKTTSELTPGSNWDTTYKYCITRAGSFNAGDRSYSVSKGDLVRYEEYSKKWVPAGVEFDTAAGVWKALNIYTIAGIASQQSPELARDTIKALFKQDISQYVDINDAAFHQAMIKFISGTDNRAKNTYFQIIGDIKKEVANPEYNAETNPNVSETIWVSDSTKDGMKVRFMQDDVDTVLLTDNSGLQTKPYNLLEASYREEDRKYWGDSNNIFFYMFDQCFEAEIKDKLRKIIDFAFYNDGNMDNKANYFYQVYFSVGDMFPAITYNHTSKIYYENAEFIKRSNALGSIYTNNNIAPIEQAHGSSIASEKDFMTRRLNFLGSYVGSPTAMGAPSLITASSGGNGDKMRLLMNFEPYQDFYPRYMWELGTPYYLGELNSEATFDSIKYLAKSGQSYEIQVTPPTATAINQGLYSTELYKKLDITGLYYSNIAADFGHMINLTIDNNNLYNIDDGGNKTIKPFFGQLPNGDNYPELNIASFTASMPVIEDLTLNNIKLPDGLDLSKFTKLQNIDLTNAQTSDITFPESGRLQTIILPNTIKTLKLYNNSGIQSIIFQGIENLETVYLNCAAVGQFDINNFLEELVNCVGLKSVTLINANIYITEEALIKLCSINTFRVQGTINVVSSSGSTTNLKAINLNTKKLLVSTFGNFKDSSSKVTINYTESTVTGNDISAATNVSLYSDVYPVTKPNIFNLQVSNGNNVAITTNSLGESILDIQYTMSGVASSIAEINKFTGVVTLKQYTTNTATVTITITLVNGTKLTKSCIVSFIWSAPAIGDFAYIDGTFSPGYDENKTIVGIVYAVEPTTDTSGTVYIIGKEYSNTVEHYGGYSNEGNSSSTDNTIKDLDYVKAILTNNNLTSYNDVGELAVITPTDNININNKPSESNSLFKGKADTKLYIDHVGQFLKAISNNSQLSRYIKQENVTVDGNSQTVYRIDNITNLNNLCTALKALNTAGMSSLDSDVISCVLYPYFYSAYLYEPVAEHGEEIDSQYLKHNWYAPSCGELQRIAYYRGYSSTGDSFINGNDVRSAISTTITNDKGIWTTPIFSIASKEMGNKFPSEWGSLFGSGNSGSVNNIVTTCANVEQNYSYQAVASYSNNTTSYNTQWIPGCNRSNWYGTNEYNNGWRLTKHFGIPFTQYNYSKA